MRMLLELLMIANAAIFLLGSIEHAGISVGPLREPVIIPAAIVEGLCAAFLAWGAVSIVTKRIAAWRAALVAHLVALAGVLLGIAALAAGAGPRTESNDIYHRIMLVLIAAGLSVLFTGPGRAALRRS